ncbi:MAG TPA: FAD-dependent oxidoreductase [Clostridiaceae bacterium]|nr:FAD-dependent oxidoreductase [Clostridiaceae bacterium]
MSKRPKIAIVGGGLTGLTAGYMLSKNGCEVHIFETDNRLGGMISGVGSTESGYVDDIYHHLFTSDKYLLSLLEELDLSSRLIWSTADNALLSGGILYPFTTALDLLRFKPIPFLQRLRTGLAVLKASRLTDWTTLEQQLASDWLRKNCGEEAWNTLWHPLLSSKFGRDATDISAVWIWNKFKLRGSSREGGKEKLGYIEGGFQILADLLGKFVSAHNGIVNTNSRVSEIFPRPTSGAKIHFGLKIQGEVYPHSFDQIICAIATEPFLEIASSFYPAGTYRDQLLAVKYKANLCLNVVYEKELSPWYWTTICDELPFVVAVEQDNLCPSPLPKGHLVYFSRYLGVEEKLWNRSDKDITEQFLRAVSAAFPSASDNKVLSTKLVRTRYSQPVVERNYSLKMPSVITPQPGLWLAGMAQIYPEDRGMNYAVRLAEEVSTLVLKDIYA